MAQPTKKAREVENLLEGLANRKEAITGDKCVAPPMGCGGPATEFRDDISRKEYRIIGWCQPCQDKFYDAPGEGE